jgi:hypothetical protein
MQSNTENRGNQRVTLSNFSVENRRSDPYTVRDERYVGHDGFVVPKDFDEFNEQFPQYVQKWVKRHAPTLARPEDLEDWSQDLIIHLKYLPQSSKFRSAGKEDVVQTFDPSRHYGASLRRFLNFINFCLANKFRTMHSKRLKNPLCRSGNPSLSGDTEAEWHGVVDDQYCHSRSSHLKSLAERMKKQQQDGDLIAQFASFVQREDSSLLPALTGIAATASKADAAAFLGATGSEFSRMHARLRQLGRCFVQGEPVPRQRRPYKRRTKISNSGTSRNAQG